MGLFDRFKLNAVADTVDRGEIDASLAPVPTYPGYDWINGFNDSTYVATREEAMSIPTVARARNILTSSISSVPIVLRDRATGARIDPPRVINTPDPRIPGSAIYAWTAEDLLFTGYAYWQVQELYADTFRIRSVERVNPYRVSTFLNSIGTEIEYYTIDGYRVPDSGIGSLVVFYGNDEGLLNRAGRTIRAGAELERAATMYAREPMPAVVLKSNGASLPPDRIAKLLEAWGTSRRNRSTAFLNSDITIETIGFDPEKMQLAAGRSYIATELARAIGIPAYFVDAESGSSMTYSNATTARQSLLDFSLIPLMTSIEERLSMPDFTPSSQVARFDLDVYLRGSAFERAQVYEILNGVGALSVEEIQRKEDMIL
jgi:HK97 family phage portal protein